jgi:hypothetical protein
MVKRLGKKGLLILFAFCMVLISCVKGDNKTVDSSNSQPTLPKLLDVGSVNFDVDPVHTASLDYTVDNNEKQKLQLTDASGLIWTLTLSPGTLDYDETITMTALSKISSKDIPGDLIGGVRLGPDGTILSIPATITVSGAGRKAVLLFFTGNQDGSNAELALPALDQTKNSATIFHFSSFWSDDVAAEKTSENPNWGDYMKGLGENLDAIIGEAEALLRDPITYPAPPPSIDLSGCKDDQGKKDDGAKLDQYMEQFIQPEIGFIRLLLSIGQAQGKATGHWDVNPNTGEPEFTGEKCDPRIQPLVEKLIERIVLKFTKLMEEYGKKTQYLAALRNILVRLKFCVALTGADEAAFVTLDNRLAALFHTAIDELLKKITDQHDYSATLEIIKLQRQAILLDYFTGEDIFSRIQKAMTFKMKGNYSWHTMDTQWELKTDFSVSFDIAAFGRLTGSGSGTIDYKYTGPSGSSTRNPTGFSGEASIKLDFCNSKALVTVMPYAAESDTITIEDMPPITNALSMTAWKAGFSDHEYKSAAGSPMGAWAFEETFWNLDPKPLNGVFDAKSATSKFAGVFTISLEHTPQK